MALADLYDAVKIKQKVAVTRFESVTEGLVLYEMAEEILNTKQMQKLDNPGRVSDLRPRELLRDVARITDGNTCVDFGSGTGMFALPMAELVGNSGRVYAIDNSAEMIAYVKAKNPPANLILINGDAGRTGLNSQIADMCLLAFILHEVKEPANLITEAFRLLKNKGKLVIVEWKADLDSPGPARRRRITKERIEQLFIRVGLNLTSYIDWSKNHYVALGNKY